MPNKNLPIVNYYIGTGVKQYCPYCTRLVQVGVCTRAEKERPEEMLLPCGCRVRVEYIETEGDK